VNQSATTMTVPELAVRVGIHESTAWRYLRAGKLPGVQIGSRWVIDRDRVERFLAGQEDAAGHQLILAPVIPATASSELPQFETAAAWLRGLHATVELLLKTLQSELDAPSSRVPS
jgi:excisionase family DNA binding protein